MTKKQKQLQFISKYITYFEYNKGQDNIVADFLSRSVQSVEANVFDLEKIDNQQKTEESMIEYEDNFQLFKIGNDDIFCGTITPCLLPFIPV